MARRFFLCTIFLLAFSASGCSPTVTELPHIEPTALPTQIVEALPTAISTPFDTQTPPSPRLPATEAEVPRVTPERAKAAFDSGKAIIVDVRSAQAYAASHITGASYIPLADIETNPDGLNLDKDQWIITYCT